VTEKDLLVLLSLATGPKHGYAVMQDVRELSGRAMGPGTLYSVIPKLEQMGFIEALPTKDRRTPYRLTGKGRGALRAEVTKRGHLMTVARQRVASL
jgi:DNA-binding PadR family transcriptional regulator